MKEDQHESLSFAKTALDNKQLGELDHMFRAASTTSQVGNFGNFGNISSCIDSDSAVRLQN